MSNIRKSDVKNHLSPRFRNKIFPNRTDFAADATTLPREQSADAWSRTNDSMEGPLSLSSTGEQRAVASTTPKHDGLTPCTDIPAQLERAPWEKILDNSWSRSAERRSQ